MLDKSITLEDLDKNNVPRHVAIIMDGNGRWASRQMQKRIFGHQHATTAVRSAIEASVELGVSYLTLYAFSTENWNRPKDEVDGLMQLFVEVINQETPSLIENGIRLRIIGDVDRLPMQSRESLLKAIDQTAAGKGLTLVLALSYSARWEVAEALKKVVDDAQNGNLTKESITEETLRNYLETRDYPDPDLMIRTGGELRVSNFLLWQMAYTEFYFMPILWPDFRKPHFYEAVQHFQSRQRRFGLTEKQVEKNDASAQ